MAVHCGLYGPKVRNGPWAIQRPFHEWVCPREEGMLPALFSSILRKNVRLIRFRGIRRLRKIPQGEREIAQKFPFPAQFWFLRFAPQRSSTNSSSVLPPFIGTITTAHNTRIVNHIRRHRASGNPVVWTATDENESWIHSVVIRLSSLFGITGFLKNTYARQDSLLQFSREKCGLGLPGSSPGGALDHSQSRRKPG